MIFTSSLETGRIDHVQSVVLHRLCAVFECVGEHVGIPHQLAIFNGITVNPNIKGTLRSSGEDMLR